jgi:hypothetical protein
MTKTHLIFTLHCRRSFTGVRETGAREGKCERERISFFFVSRGQECLCQSEREIGAREGERERARERGSYGF